MIRFVPTPHNTNMLMFRNDSKGLTATLTLDTKRLYIYSDISHSIQRSEVHENVDISSMSKILEAELK